MLFRALFGNANIEKVLFFLLVNEKCYAAQLSYCLEGSLTPIQQALGRLEKGGILTSTLEGKTRFFRFNPHYPFFRELQTLLKQGYQHLTLHDQQAYYCPPGSLLSRKSNQLNAQQQVDPRALQGALPLLWQRLLQVKHLSFSAQSKAEQPSGWNGFGKANVEVHRAGTHALIFQEQGSWTSDEGNQFDFKNTFRWTWHPSKSLLTLEHLRHGPEHPIVLFELAPVSQTQFAIVHPFLCRQDTYLAYLCCNPQIIQLDWRIIGPRKNEAIHYIYT